MLVDSSMTSHRENGCRWSVMFHIFFFVGAWSDEAYSLEAEGGDLRKVKNVMF